MSLIRLLLFLLLTVVGAAFSFWSLIEHTHIQFGIKSLPLCNISEQISCGAVLGSEFAVLFGIPLGALGLFFYLGNFFAFLRRQKGDNSSAQGDLLLFVHSLSVLFSLYLLGISHLIIGTLCPICMGMYLVNILLFIILLTEEPIGSFLSRVTRGLTGIISITASFFVSSSESTSSKIIWWMPLGIILSAVVAFSVSPLLYIKANQSIRDSMVQEWLAQPTQEIPKNLTAGMLQDYFKGSSSAPVELVEFFDFQCPACQNYYFVLEDMAEQYGDDLLVVLKNYPLDSNCNPSVPSEFRSDSCFLALFSRCAGEQGRYFDVANFLMSLDTRELDQQGITARQAVMEESPRLNLDKTAMIECLEADRQREKIMADIELGNRLGLESTPTVWINQKKVSNIHPEVVKQILNHILGKSS